MIPEGEPFLELFNNEAHTYDEFLAKCKPDYQSKYRFYYRKTQITDEDREFLQKIEHEIKIFAIGAEWCDDSQFGLSIIQRLVENSNRLALRILMKEERPDLLPLTNGGQRLPYVFFLSHDGYVVERWVERATVIYELVGNLRKELGWDNPNFRKVYRKAFAKNYDRFIRATIEEIKQKIHRTDALLSTSSRIHRKKT